MSFIKSSGFKYAKNFIIGIGAAVVMIGALGKIKSAPWGDLAITAGLVTEAILFAILGIIPPEKDYYWEKLYPGLEKYGSKMTPLTEGGSDDFRPLKADVVENNLGSMVTELQTMSKSLGSLKALQDVDFSTTGDQIKAMSSFYDRMNDAMQSLAEASEDTKRYKAQLSSLNENMASMNNIYSGMINHYDRMSETVSNISASLEDTVQYKEQLASLNKNLGSLNTVYGNVLSAFGGRG